MNISVSVIPPMVVPSGVMNSEAFMIGTLSHSSDLYTPKWANLQFTRYLFTSLDSTNVTPGNLGEGADIRRWGIPGKDRWQLSDEFHDPTNCGCSPLVLLCIYTACIVFL